METCPVVPVMGAAIGGNSHYNGHSIVDGVNCSNLRYENAKSEAEIRSDVKDAQCETSHAILKAESEIRRDVAQAECSIKDTINNRVSQTERYLSDKIEGNAKESLKQHYEGRIEGLKTAETINKTLCDIQRQLDCSLRDQSLFFSNSIRTLENSINSIEQNQRFSSKTVQFGTGNLAGTAQTANQG